MNQLRIILQSKIFFLTIILFTFLYVFWNVKGIRYQSIYSINETKFVGKISKIKTTDYGYSVTLKAKEDLIVYIEELNYHLGDTVEIEGTLEIPKNNTVLGNFNYKEYLYQNKIFYILKASHIKLIKENSNLIYKLKDYLLKYMDHFKSKDYLKSFILGDTSYLGNDLYESYQINGVCHLLAIGSLHITLLSFLILAIFKKCKVNEIVSHSILFIILLLFIILTDYPISIIRVYIYLIVSFLNKKLKLNLQSIQLFILTMIITLLINPFYIYHKGFLYSYSISFILILNKDKLTGNYFTKLMKISIISFLYSIPFNIYFNYSLNLLSIFYNLFYVPIFNIIIFPLSLLTLLFPFLDNILYLLMEILNNISYTLNHFTWGIMILKKISIFILIIYLVFITFVIKDFLNKKIKTLVILMVILVIHLNINILIKKNFFVIIDVNQGDSSLFYSNNKSILIDTGGLYNQEVSKKTITMLKSLGIKEIEYLFLTHGDFDHMGDSIYFVNHFKVKNVVLNSNELNNLETKLINVLEKKNINYSIGYQDMTYIINNIQIKLLNSSYENENDSSLVMYILFKNKKILMMGDASSITEKDILKNYQLPYIDYLKVGHHGSKTSTSLEFLEVIRPKYAFISVGLNNLYHHPSSVVIDYLNQYNALVYKTSEVGSIFVELEKNGTIHYLAP